MLHRLGNGARGVEAFARRRRKQLGLLLVASMLGGYGLPELGVPAGAVLLLLPGWPLFILLAITLPKQPFLARDR